MILVRQLQQLQQQLLNQFRLLARIIGELKQGAEYVSGQYTYRYMQEGEGNSWVNITNDGWGVVLTNKNSTDPVTTKLCNSINGKPIVSMSSMFYFSKSSVIDMSSFDTRNVKNMRNMFWSTQAKSLDLSKFNTSNVVYMDSMFHGSQATTIKRFRKILIQVK
ncbi:MAG: DUF285 domain-containing protein [Clostridium sp.]|nr:MAG: DUF285 domain-containing protein [Clostridium sp.]